MKNQYIGENILKRRLGQFTDLRRGGLTKKTRGGDVFERGRRGVIPQCTL